MLMKMRSKMQRTNNQKGFTLVELMVVVVIVGILVAIAVPVYNSVTAKAELGAIQSNLRTIDGAIMMAKASETGTLTQASDFTDTIMKKYVTGWPIKGPGDCTYQIIEKDSNIRAQVTITTKKEGGLAAGTYYLVNDEVKSST